MNLVDIYAQIAEYSRRVVARVHYPAPSVVPTGAEPQLIIFSGLVVPVTAVGEFDWNGTARGQLVASQLGETPKELGKIDELLEPLVLLFMPGGAGYHLTDTTGVGIDFCQIQSVNPSQVITFAGHQFLGAEVVWEFKARAFYPGQGA